MKRSCVAVLAVLTGPLLMGGHCTNNSKPTTANRLAAAMDRLDREPGRWQEEFRRLEEEVGSENPRLAADLAAIRVEALAILADEPRCEAWIQRFAYGTLVARRAALAYGESAPPPAIICTDVLGKVNLSQDSEVLIHGFTTLGVERLGGRADISGWFSGADATEPIVRGPGRIAFDLRGVCGRGTFEITWADRQIASFELDTTTEADPECVSEARLSFAEQGAACTSSCCAYADSEACVRDYCDAECSQKKAKKARKAAPKEKGEPEDACSASSAFYTWCHHDFCPSITSCRKEWCEGDAPKKKACMDEAEVILKARIDECPKTDLCRQRN